jgi:hypothetical protein
MSGSYSGSSEWSVRMASDYFSWVGRDQVIFVTRSGRGIELQ